MNLKPVVLGLLAAACITAAAGGAYVAVRQNGVVRTTTSATPATNGPGSPAAQPVTETEALVGQPSPATATPAEAPDSSASSDRTPRRNDTARPVPVPVPDKVASAPRQAEKPIARREDPPRPTDAARRSTASGSPAPAAQPARETSSVAAPVSDLPAADPARTVEAPPAPPEPRFVEVVVPASAVIGLQVDRSLSSETARVEDRIEARVTRDVMADGRRAIPSGSRMLGSVVLVDRGGKMKDAARLGVRFHTLVLADGTEMPLRTEAIFRDGESPGNESSRKIGGAAVGGAILGAILGGGKGAVLGGATGAAGGTAAVMAGGRNAATLPAGTIVTARVAGPVTIQVEKE
jgi:hypothetical protein